jgi:shikimate kinase
MKVFLLGLPGSGKTTLGKDLATSLGVKFIDLDKEIEMNEGTTIREIFQIKKEDYFRKVESAVLKKWCESPADFVMATGGGAPVFFDNMALINKSGLSVFLDVPASEITNRILKTNTSDRPLFADTRKENLKEQIEFMRSQRVSHYRQAGMTFSGKEITAKEILERIRTESRS